MDASCLIGLERLARLALLPALFAPVYAPPAVVREFGTAPPWLEVRSPERSRAADVLALPLGAGEKEAIALAREFGCRVVLDDRQARALARRLGVPMLGTVGVLVRAKRAGHMDQLAPLLDRLNASGFRLDDRLKLEALRLTGELP